MGMAKTEICNLALLHLGMTPIVDISDANPSARALALLWNACRDDVFSEHQWPFADAQIVLAESSVDIVGWDYCYAYPANVARVWTVYDESTINKKGEQEFEKKHDPDSGKNVLCSNIAEAVCDATYIVEDTMLWDAKFCLAFSFRLAANACLTLTDPEKATALMNTYNAILAEAKRIGASEKKKKYEKSTTYIDARG